MLYNKANVRSLLMILTFRTTPLMIAAMYGCLDNVSLLLDLGAKIDEINDQGKTALDLAVENGFPRIVQLLQTKKREIPVLVKTTHIGFNSVKWLCKRIFSAKIVVSHETLHLWWLFKIV